VIKPWRWHKSLAEVTTRGLPIWHLRDGRSRDRATIWQNADDRFTWHTWDENGTGGENDEAAALDDAKRHCVAAIVRQGWAPGGWQVEW
jgi:hypothetical protein